MSRINWKEQFDVADAEIYTLSKEKRVAQLKEIAIKLILDMKDEKLLSNVTTFIACYNDKSLVRVTKGWDIIEKGGVYHEEN